MFAKSVVAVALLSGFVAAQNNSTYIDPNSVPLSTKASWCNGQNAACITLCDQDPSSNLCDDTTLDWTCLCSNGSSPDIAAYMDTVPYYICEQSYDDCVADNPNDALAQQNCKTQIQDDCGSLNTANYTAASTSSMASSTSSSAPSSTAAAATTTSASASATATAKSAATAMLIGRDYGIGLIAAGIMAAFGFML